ERDEPVTPALELLRLRVGGFHRLALEQLRDQVPEQCPAMRRRPPELLSCRPVPHGSGGLTLARQATAVELVAAREVLRPHAESEPHLVQDLLDLVQRLATEVLGLEHLLLGLLDELAEITDVGVLEAVRGAHAEFQILDRPVEVLVDGGLAAGLTLGATRL